MFTDLFLKRYSFIIGCLSFIFVAYIVFMNIYILNLGKNFANEHNASGYEITYRTKFEPEELSLNDGTSYIDLPSRFIFYDNMGNNLVVSKHLAYEYHVLNKNVLNLEDTYSVVGSFLFVISAFGLFLCFWNRYNVSGYILLTIYTIITGFKLGTLDVLSVILVLIGALGTILVYKTRFVDWNENIFLSFKSKKNKC